MNVAFWPASTDTLASVQLGCAATVRLADVVVDAGVVAVEARRHRDAGPPAPAVVVPIGARLTHRPAPSLAGYDELLELAR